MRYLIPLILFLTACQPGVPVPSDSGRETAVPPMPTLAPDMIRLGETVYAQACASCHGADLEGEPDWKTQNEDGSFQRERRQ